MTAATTFADLNRLLDELVGSVRAILGANLVGAYLQGSFALGDADTHSDVDFVIVTAGAVSDAQLRGLQAMHRRIHAQAVPWAQHLEGSYIPRRRLHRVDPARRPFLYLDNGADQLVRDPHCNTAVVRWILREHGVVLVGPQPATLVAPVSPDDLRREARAALLEYGAWAREPGALGVMSQWKQTYLVVTFCRILHTLATGTVGSKREAAAWALANLPPAWHALIERAVADRADPWGRVHRPADHELVTRTLAFADHALAATPSYTPPRRSNRPAEAPRDES